MQEEWLLNISNSLRWKLGDQEHSQLTTEQLGRIVYILLNNEGKQLTLCAKSCNMQQPHNPRSNNKNIEQKLS